MTRATATGRERREGTGDRRLAGPRGVVFLANARAFDIAGALAPDDLSSVLPDLPETSLDTCIAATNACYRARAAARAAARA